MEFGLIGYTFQKIFHSAIVKEELHTAALTCQSPGNKMIDWWAFTLHVCLPVLESGDVSRAGRPFMSAFYG